MLVSLYLASSLRRTDHALWNTQYSKTACICYGIYCTPLGNLYITNVIEADQHGNQLYKCYARNAEVDSATEGSYARISVEGNMDKELYPIVLFWVCWLIHALNSKLNRRWIRACMSDYTPILSYTADNKEFHLHLNLMVTWVSNHSL